MTDVTQAYAALRAVLTPGASIPLRWQNEDGGPLPDTPSAFAYVEFLAERGQLASFGGGRGANRYRHPAVVNIWVFVPVGEGLASATTKAEAFAALLRSYRDEHVSCFDATVHPGGSGSDLTPPGLSSEVGNYWWACTEVSLFFDQIG